VRSVRVSASAPPDPDGATARPGHNAKREGWRPDQGPEVCLKADTTYASGERRDGDGPCGAMIEPGVAGRTAFTLRVQTGCAEPCSYCIIPSTRGRPRSVPVQDLLREVERIAASGFKEIALTGVHLGSYGRDFDPPSSLLQILQHLDSWSARASAERVQFRNSS